MRFTAQEELALPIRAVRCPYCEQWVQDDGFGPMETLWMHEYECDAIRMAYELAPDEREEKKLAA